MSALQIKEHLRHLTNAERLEVIETATRLIREDMHRQVSTAADSDPVLKVAGCLSGEPLTGSGTDRHLYGEGEA